MIWEILLSAPPLLRNTFVKTFKSDIWNSIDDQSLPLLIHVPKTGGTSLANSIYGHTINHYPAWAWKAANSQRYNSVEKITVVREPLGRLASCVQHCLDGRRAVSHELRFGCYLQQFGTSTGNIVRAIIRNERLLKQCQSMGTFKKQTYWLWKDDCTIDENIRIFTLPNTFTAQGENMGNYDRRNIHFTDDDIQLARTILADEYEVYDNPAHERITDVFEIQELLIQRT